MIPPQLKTNRFTLGPYQAKDEDRFVEMALDPVSIKFMGGSSGIEANERAMFQKILTIYEKNDKRWFWIWGVCQEDRLCAHLELKETGHTNEGELEVVYMVHPDARGKGLMTEVLALLKEMQSTWDRRIIATLSAENTNSMKLLKRWGIEQEEIIRDEEDDDEYLKVLLAV